MDREDAPRPYLHAAMELKLGMDKTPGYGPGAAVISFGGDIRYHHRVGSERMREKRARVTLTARVDQKRAAPVSGSL